MLNGNLIILILSVVAMFALGMDSKNKNTIRENYAGGMPQLAITVDPINTSSMTSVMSSPLRNNAVLGAGITNRLGADLKGMYVTNPAFQANLSPRFNPTALPPYIRSRMPGLENQGVPSNPLGYPNSLPGSDMNAKDFGKMACKENFSANKPSSESYCGASSYGAMVPPNYKADQSKYNAIAKDVDKVTLQDFTPGMDMTSLTSAGEVQNIRMINRYMYANKKDRLLSLADPIRGDLAIVPQNTGWFQVSAQPVTQLNPGAMAVMGGTPLDWQAGRTYALQSAFGGNAGQFAGSIAGLGFEPLGFGNSKMAIEKSIGIDNSEAINVRSMYSSENVVPGTQNYVVSSFN